ACEGAILVVDASQGIQAQTISNLFLALDAGLEIIPVLNKIDLPGAEPDRRAKEIHELIGAKPDEILRISAKEGTNVPELLEAVVRRVPPPRGTRDAPLRALIFDSYYDRYRGAIPSIRVVDGVLTPGMKIAFGAHTADLYEASLHCEPESSVALGFRFRCGFVGLLHMEIVRERLEREFNLDLISTVPNVEYHVHRTDGTVEVVENPSLMPHGSEVDHIAE